MSLPTTAGLPSQATAAPTHTPLSHSQSIQTQQVPLSRRPSRLSSALTHAKSIDTHPPHSHTPAHAHFEDDENQPGGVGDVAEIGRERAIRIPEAETETTPTSVVDIEHVPVDDDPREWSDLKKNLVLTMMTISVVRLSFADAVRVRMCGS
jgi:hypothetical protein